MNIILWSTPIKQKKKTRQESDRNKEINVKVAKLVNAGILREAIFLTWITNRVKVKRHDGSWQMCIDYSDLNNACLKDHYPLPKIDQKVGSLEDFQFKCFIDAYKGYHQV